MNIHIMRLPAVCEAVGLKRGIIHRMVREGKFPRPVQLTTRATGWRSTDVEEWIASRPPAELRPVGRAAQATQPAQATA